MDKTLHLQTSETRANGKSAGVIWAPEARWGGDRLTKGKKQTKYYPVEKRWPTKARTGQKVERKAQVGKLELWIRRQVVTVKSSQEQRTKESKKRVEVERRDKSSP